MIGRNNASHRRSSVTFSREVKVKCTMPLEAYTETEYNSCWYNDAEKETMRSEIRETGSLLLSKAMIDEKNITKRGLEGQFGELKNRKLIAREQALNAVLDEQYCQCIYDEPMNDEAIAQAYQQHTRESRLSAVLLAISDEEAVSPLVPREKRMPRQPSKQRSFDVTMMRKHHGGGPVLPQSSPLILSGCKSHMMYKPCYYR